MAGPPQASAARRPRVPAVLATEPAALPPGPVAGADAARDGAAGEGVRPLVPAGIPTSAYDRETGQAAAAEATLLPVAAAVGPDVGVTLKAAAAVAAGEGRKGISDLWVPAGAPAARVAVGLARLAALAQPAPSPPAVETGVTVGIEIPGARDVGAVAPEAIAAIGTTVPVKVSAAALLPDRTG